MPVYTTKSKILTEERVKKVMLDCVEVNTNCPESVRKYGERCQMIGELYNGYKNYMEIENKQKVKPREVQFTSTYEISPNTIGQIDRLLSYKDEYIG